VTQMRLHQAGPSGGPDRTLLSSEGEECCRDVFFGSFEHLYLQALFNYGLQPLIIDESGL